MTVYVDSTKDYGPKGLWCHMFADTPAELDMFARRIGLKPEWKHNDHYDLRPARRAAAVGKGAVQLDDRSFAAMVARSRQARSGR